jgi:hypothetical protein
MWKRLHVKYRYSFLILMKLWIFLRDFRKKKKGSNIKFHQNACSVNRAVVPCKQTNGRTDMTKLKVVSAILRTRLKILRLLMISRSKFWLNRSYWHTIRCAVSHFQFSVAVKRFTSGGINQLSILTLVVRHADNTCPVIYCHLWPVWPLSDFIHIIS